jgi:hypothetical protein
MQYQKQLLRQDFYVYISRNCGFFASISQKCKINYKVSLSGHLLKNKGHQ